VAATSAAPVDTGAAALALRAARPSPALEGAERARDLQPRVGQLQQGLAYTQQLGAALQQLRNGLGAVLAQDQPTVPASLEQQLETVTRLWQSRPGASAGQIDGQLEAVAPDAQAQQVFRLRGLDSRALASSAPEILQLSLPGKGRTAVIELNGGGLAVHVAALRRGLAALGIQLQGVDRGEVTLSVAESDWPALRDGLVLRGDGKRYPNGELVRAPLEAQPDAMAPLQWQIRDMAAQRRSLALVLDAQTKLALAQGRLSGALTQAAEQLAPPDPQRGAAVRSFVDSFAERAQSDPDDLDYATLAELAPALRGLHRGAVSQLLLGFGS
jgi:exonuclease VII small subunit